jgi:hypothetical protein
MQALNLGVLPLRSILDAADAVVAAVAVAAVAAVAAVPNTNSAGKALARLGLWVLRCAVAAFAVAAFDAAAAAAAALFLRATACICSHHRLDALMQFVFLKRGRGIYQMSQTGGLMWKLQ